MRRLLFSILCLCSTLMLYSQAYSGRILDEKNTPIPYVNVVLLQVSDSTFINGCITNHEGKFILGNDLAISKIVLKISHVGYRTQIIQPQTYELGDVLLVEEGNALQEVVIKVKKPLFDLNSGVLTANVKGTIYNKLGTASDVLRQLPFVIDKGGKIEVFGRGIPLIFLNNRQIRNENELEQLKSENIKDIQIILNPGSQYSSNVESVIKIATLRPQDEGLGGAFSVRGKQKRMFVHNEQLDVTYRKGGWDLFSTISYNGDKWRQSQIGKEFFTHNDDKYSIFNNGNIGFENKNLNLVGGLNFNQKHNHIGFRYSFSKSFDVPAYIRYDDCYSMKNEVLTPYSINNETERNGSAHYINTYYRRESENKSTLNLEATVVTRNNFRSDVAVENRERQEIIVPSEGSDKSDLYVFKVWGNCRLWNGSLEIGAEGTRTINKQIYITKNQDMLFLRNTITEVKQNALSTYVSYTKNWKHLSANVGLRHEYVSYDYFLNGEKDVYDDYHNFFPSISVSYKKDKFAVSFSYRTTFIRPYYNALRSNISYTDSFNYESGNPNLKTNVNHRLGILIHYNDFTMDLNYRFRVDDIMLYQYLYKNNPIVMTSFTNHDRRMFYANISYSPSISFWKPTFELGLSSQNMCYKGYDYDKPVFNYGWRNMFLLPNNWMMTFNLYGSSYGHTGFEVSRPTFNSDVSIKKSFGKTLDLYLGAMDLFNTYRERWIIRMQDDISYEKWNDIDYRCFYVRAVLKLNKASNKYKGGTAGASERSRL